MLHYQFVDLTDTLTTGLSGGWSQCEFDVSHLIRQSKTSDIAGMDLRPRFERSPDRYRS